MPFEPCFNLDKKDDRSFRGSVSGMGFAYCDFRHQGGGQQMLMARAVARPRALHRMEVTGSTETQRSFRAGRDAAVESGKIEPVRSEPAPAKTESAPELRRSTE